MSSELGIRSLVTNIQGDVVIPESPDYDQAIARWAANSQRKAKIVVFVKTEQDVVRAIQFARTNHLSLAVRGGGHSSSGASSIEDGLVIDLSRYLNTAVVDPKAQTVAVGGGALWGAVDKAAIQHGLATVGGMVNHTGVGGLTLGGGFGYLTPSHGLAIDNLLQATVVTANGSVLKASKNENSDLFFAIRGGGGNFGVVTEFVFRLHHQRRTVYAGPIFYSPELLEKIVELTKHWFKNAGEKEGVVQSMTVGPDGQPVVILFLFYNGSEEEGRKNYKAFFDLGPMMDLTKEIPYEELNGLQNATSGHGKGVYLKGVAHKEPHYSSIKRAHEMVTKALQGGHFNGAVLFEYLPLEKVYSVPADETAFRREKVSSVVVLLNWDPSQDRTSEARALTREVCSIIVEGQKLTESEGLGYTNFDPDAADTESAAHDKARRSFGVNYPRLQEIKKRYDPDNIFNKWFPILPAA